MSDSIQEPGSRRLIMSMAIAGFISGFIIIAIYLLTFDTIKENKARELQQAVFKVLPGATKMQKLHYENNQLVLVHIDGVDDEMIFAGYDEKGQFIGYAIQGAGPGFQDTISLLFGYLSTEKMVIGMEILDSRETPGLGDKIFKDMDFVNEFKGLSIKSDLKAVKKGKKIKETEIDAITGATISSKAVVKIINKAYKKWSPQIPPVGNEPAWVENNTAQKTESQ
ncbi:MAG: RnfABCDGE type electron transport complex subunit G [gamma proteobacterium symbiont of Taylorina sp.]|nr:RnfABCDGE type electron transport complex subunit G [gamma proteobacterium symbiont of Taylorina sp.]